MWVRPKLDFCQQPKILTLLQVVQKGIENPLAGNWLNTDTLCSEATALMKHTVDKGVVKDKMKQTFTYRQTMVHDLVKSSNIFTVFPRFLDIAGWAS